MKTIALTALPSLLLAACSGAALDPAPPSDREPASSARAPTGEPATTQALAAAETVLTGKLMPALIAEAKPNDNVFIAPVSLSQAFGLAWLGAEGETREEIGATMGWQGLANPAGGALAYVEALEDTGDEEVRLGVANRLWVTNAYPLKPSYLAAVKRDYRAEPGALDFGGNPGGAADAINGWVSEETEGLIKQIVKPEQFDGNTVTVLTNAVFFDGQWTVPFGGGGERPFTRGDGTKAPFYLMYRDGPMPFVEADGWQGVALPYGKSKRYRMDVYLPPEGQLLTGTGAWLSSDWIAKMGAALDDAPEREIELRMPRFEIAWNGSMNAAFKAAGMIVPFDRSRADFKPMVEVSGRNAFIDSVSHATFLKVDEKGTKAAGATAIEVTVESATLYFAEMTVDRPFLVALRDTKTGSLLFFGRISDPQPTEAAR